jgi:hypothetical protein
VELKSHHSPFSNASEPHGLDIPDWMQCFPLHFLAQNRKFRRSLGSHLPTLLFLGRSKTSIINSGFSQTGLGLRGDEWDGGYFPLTLSLTLFHKLFVLASQGPVNGRSVGMREGGIWAWNLARCSTT